MFEPPVHRARHHLDSPRNFGDITHPTQRVVDAVQVHHPFFEKRYSWYARCRSGCVRKRPRIDRKYKSLELQGFALLAIKTSPTLQLWVSSSHTCPRLRLQKALLSTSSSNQPYSRGCCCSYRRCPTIHEERMQMKNPSRICGRALKLQGARDTAQALLYVGKYWYT